MGEPRVCWNPVAKDEIVKTTDVNGDGTPDRIVKTTTSFQKGECKKPDVFEKDDKQPKDFVRYQVQYGIPKTNNFVTTNVRDSSIVFTGSNGEKFKVGDKVIYQGKTYEILEFNRQSYDVVAGKADEVFLQLKGHYAGGNEYEPLADCGESGARCGMTVMLKDVHKAPAE